MKTDLYEHKMQIGSYVSADSNSHKKQKLKMLALKCKRKIKAAAFLSMIKPVCNLGLADQGAQTRSLSRPGKHSFPELEPKPMHSVYKQDWSWQSALHRTDVKKHTSFNWLVN